MNSDSLGLPVSHGSTSETLAYELYPLRSDKNNNNRTSSPSAGTEDLYSPSSSSSDKDTQLSPENYLDEDFYGKLKVKVRRDGKKLTEKRRRQDLQQQYSNLRMLVPGLQDVEGRTPFSRNVILKNTLHYIEQLKISVSSSLHLANELRLEQEYNQRLERELQTWQKKVTDLRRKKHLNPGKSNACGHKAVVNNVMSPYGRSKLSSQNHDGATEQKPTHQSDNFQAIS